MSSSEWEEPERKKVLDQPSIAAGATINSDPIILERMEMMVITAQVKYAAGADVSVQVKVKYCPKGGIWDTIDYTSFYLTYDAGKNVKRSIPIDVPAMGSLLVQLYNGDGQAVERSRVWYTAQRRKVD